MQMVFTRTDGFIEFSLHAKRNRKDRVLSRLYSHVVIRFGAVRHLLLFTSVLNAGIQTFLNEHYCHIRFRVSTNKGFA